MKSMMRRNLNQSMENYIDEDVERCFNWLKSFMSPKEWQERRSKIENYIENTIMAGYGMVPPSATAMPFSFNEDKIAWYMYLMDTCMYNANCYEPVTGARIFPLFKRLGEAFNELNAIEGVTKKVRRLIKKDPSEADAVLFELLVALLWVRNGFMVSFLDELKHTKQPDIIAIKDGEKWFIECKRLSKSSDYSAREKEKWYKMLSYIKNLLIERDMVLDIIIHEELEKLPDTFLVEQLSEKLKLVVKPGVVVDNNLLNAKVRFVDYEAINNHLKKFSVRSPSPQLSQLIAGEVDANRGFSSGTFSNVFRLGSGIGNNIFVDHVGKAFGVFWSCDAPAATDKKARDIKKQLDKALSQLPSEEHSVVHIGIETYDGPKVEMDRFKKINDTVEQLIINDQNLAWIYIHFFQSYAPPDQTWVFDESLVRFKNVTLIGPEPLENTSHIVPFDKTEENNLHWFKPQP